MKISFGVRPLVDAPGCAPFRAWEQGLGLFAGKAAHGTSAFVPKHHYLPSFGSSSGADGSTSELFRLGKKTTDTVCTDVGR